MLGPQIQDPSSLCKRGRTFNDDHRLSESVHVIFKAGKAHKGYFTLEDILKQASCVMDILLEDYSDDEHWFVYDNATTHLK